MERKGFSHQVFELEGGNFKIQFDRVHGSGVADG